MKSLEAWVTTHVETGIAHFEVPWYWLCHDFHLLPNPVGHLHSAAIYILLRIHVSTVNRQLHFKFIC